MEFRVVFAGLAVAPGRGIRLSAFWVGLAILDVAGPFVGAIKTRLEEGPGSADFASGLVSSVALVAGLLSITTGSATG